MGVTAIAAIALISAPASQAIASTKTADPANTEPVSQSETVINLNWATEHHEYTDVGPEGPSSGDTTQFAFGITGDFDGTADYSCTVVQTNFICDGIIRLPDGDIYVMTGPVDQSEPAPIIGGTRSYAGIRGEFTKTANEDDTKGTYQLTFSK